MLRKPSVGIRLGVLVPSFGLTAACGDVVTIPVEDHVPVIHGMLVAGDSTHTFIIEPSIPFGRLSEPSPFAPDDVDLEILPPNAAPWPLQPDPASPLDFIARGDVAPLATYELLGRVAGFAMRARVTVPSALEITSPPGDSVVAGVGDTVRLTFHAERALGFLMSATKVPASGGLHRRDFTRLNTLELVLEEGIFFPDDRITVTVLALDSQSTRYLEQRAAGGRDPTILPSNVEGGAGVVSGATAAQRVVIVR